MTEISFHPYFLAIGANLCFGTASIAFSKFAISHSATFINQLKVSVAFVCFLIAFLFFEKYQSISIVSNVYLLSSGFIGLCVADLFLFRSLATLGPARTLVLYSFQPFLLAGYGYFLLGQTLSHPQMLAILCMIACVLTFVYERSRTHGRIDIFAFFTAFSGVFFDAIGIMLSRQAYEGSPSLGSFQANGLRAMGALIGFFVINPKSFSRLFQDVKIMPRSEKSLAIGASVLGTFVSLSLYLQALKTAHIATLTSISITLPIWVSLIEHIRLKAWPSLYLWIAFALFLVGFILMNLGSL